MKGKILLSVLTVLLVFFVSCDLPVRTTITPEKQDIPLEYKYELFEPDQNNAGKYIFEINDKSYLRPTGYTFWSENYTNSRSSFEGINYLTEKSRGSSQSGYGIVFCCKRDTSSGNVYFLAVMINDKKEYNIGKVVNGKFTSLTSGWKKCIYLTAGTDEILIRYLTSGENKNKFELSLNGYSVEYFVDQENPITDFTGTKYGFLVCIGPNEDFDNSSVKVIFEKKF